MDDADGTSGQLVACPDCGRSVLVGGHDDGPAATIWLPVDLDSVAAARAHAVAVLRREGVDPARVDDVVQLVSELATDAVRQTTTEFFGVVVSIGHERVNVDVRVLAHGPSTTAEPGAGPAPEGGSSPHRRAIIDALADEWGIDRTQRSATSWFALAVHPSTRGGTSD